MIIEKIIIKSFGLITDMTLEFSETVNVIEGQNESGKSTIAAFIRYMLYGFDNDEPAGAVSERQKRINWYNGVASGSMYVSVQGKRYLITRTTTPTEGAGGRVTYREEAAITDLETGTPAFGKMPAGEVFFGVDKELFDNTAFIGQIYDTGIDEDSVKASIENILFSGNERINTQRALNKMNDKMENLMHQGASGGVIYDLMRKCDDYREKIDKCREDSKRILVKEAELHEVRREREQAIADREHFREIDSCYNNMMIIQTFDRLHELEEDAERRAEEYNSFIEENKKNGFVPGEMYLTELAVSRELAEADYKRLKDAEDTLEKHKRRGGITNETEALIAKCDSMGGEKKILADAKRGYFGGIWSLALGIFGVLGMVAAAVMLVLGFGASPSALMKILGSSVGALSLAICTVSAVFGIKYRNGLKLLLTAFGTENHSELVGKIGHISEERSARDSMNAALKTAEDVLASAKANYTSSKGKLTETVNLWSDGEAPVRLDEYLDKLESNVRAFLAKKAELYTAKTQTESTVREIRHTLAGKSEIDIRAQVSPLKRKALAGTNHLEIVTGIAEQKEKIADREARVTEIERELAMLKSSVGDLAEYHAKLDTLENRTEELKTKHKAYFVAADAISHAMENLRTEISPRLGGYATSMMETMTSGKYSGFELDDKMELTFASDDGSKRSVDFLSNGTRDLAYIAVRCALIDMLYREKPPVCFDESFAHQDNVRAKAMMKAVMQLAAEKCQSFIFTCRNREAALAKELISAAGVFKLSVADSEAD